MTVQAGEKVTASVIGLLGLGSADASALSFTTTQTVIGDYEDALGASLIITTVDENTIVHIDGIFDVTSNGTTDKFMGSLAVDALNTTATQFAQYVGVGRATIQYSWRVVLADVGNHTLRLYVEKDDITDVVTITGGHTRIVAMGAGIAGG